jgi:HEPN domain-containing protein
MNRRDRRRLPASPEEWISHANSDLKLACLAAGDPDIRPEQACFHAQQAAEKAIKGVLISENIDFPLSHDIEELLEIAENAGVIPPKEVASADLLTPYAAETRYPGYWEEISEADVDNALKMAEQTVFWARNLLR